MDAGGNRLGRGRHSQRGRKHTRAGNEVNPGTGEAGKYKIKQEKPNSVALVLKSRSRISLRERDVIDILVYFSLCLDEEKKMV